MNYLKFLKIPVILIFLVVVSFSAVANDYISIEKLIEENKLDVIINGIGKHQEDCIRFDIVNKTSESLKVTIEAGRRLNSYDSAYQDIFIVKNKSFVLKPFEQKVISGYGFCCQSHHASPPKNAKFSIGKIQKEWLELAQVIDLNSFPSQAIQQAVWVLSNDHNISSISASDMKKILSLRKTVAKIKGVELPWYILTYVEDTTRLFSDRPKRIIGTLNYEIKTSAIVTIVIRNRFGELASILVKETPSKGKLQYHLDLLVKDWPKGEYGIFVYEDFSNLNMSKKFKL